MKDVIILLLSQMNSKYRTYDYSTNIILNSKLTTQAQYRGLKSSNNNSSYKKMESLNIKIFDRLKRNPRILSRNDRVDLFLQGGNFSQTRRTQHKFCNDRSFYKAMRMKKKSEVFASLRNQVKLNNEMNNNESPDSQPVNLTKQDINYLRTSEGPRVKQANSEVKVVIRSEFYEKTYQSSILKQRSPQKKHIRNNSRDRQRNPKQNQSVSNSMSQMKNEQNKTQQKIVQKINTFHRSNLNMSSENQLQKIQKINRPLFYLQQKQISNIKADSFLVKQYPSGQLIFGNYFKKTGEIASLTKIMTFYTVYEIAEKYKKDVKTQIIQIDEQAQSMTGTSAEIFVGDSYTIEQLLYGLMLPSGNDAATALAKWGGKILEENDLNFKAENKNSQVKTFVKYMNLMGKKCGMKASKFCNPHGLPHAQSSSNAQDLACLISDCLKIPLFKQVIKTKKYTFWAEHNGVKHQVIWQNTNKLLRRPHFIGGKTGVTVSAGPCLASCYELGDKILIVIVLRTNKLSRRFKDTRHIIGLALSKLNKNFYKEKIKQVLKNDPELDSDNSDDEQQFNYEKNDAKQMAKRNKILTFQM